MPEAQPAELGYRLFALLTLDHAGGLLEPRVVAFGTKLDMKPSEVFKEKVYVECIQKLDPYDVKGIMRDNALSLVS